MAAGCGHGGWPSCCRNPSRNCAIPAVAMQHCSPSICVARPLALHLMQANPASAITACQPLQRTEAPTPCPGTHLSQHPSCLLPAHDADACIGPHVHEVGAVRTATHACTAHDAENSTSTSQISGGSFHLVLQHLASGVQQAMLAAQMRQANCSREDALAKGQPLSK